MHYAARTYPSSLGMRSSGAAGRYSITNICAAAIILIPYELLSPVTTILVILFLSLVGGFAGMMRKSVNLGAFWIFLYAIVAQTLLSLHGGINWSNYFSQSNHFWQFCILFFFLSHVFANSNWESMIASPKFLLLLVGSNLVNIFTKFLSGGGFGIYEFNVNILFLLGAALIQDHRSRTNFLMFGLLIAIALALFSRSSSYLILATAIICYVFPVHLRIAKVLAMVIVAAPVVIYLNLSHSELLGALQFDHNTYIRAEFMRGSVEYIKHNFLFGIGFDHPYRDVGFHYITHHPFLIRPDIVDIVSNHHSIYDTVLRTGIVGAGPLCWLLWGGVRPTRGRRFTAFLLLMMAFGLSLNAWMEDQKHLAMVAVIAVLSNRALHSTRPDRRFGAPPWNPRAWFTREEQPVDDDDEPPRALPAPKPEPS